MFKSCFGCLGAQQTKRPTVQAACGASVSFQPLPSQQAEVPTVVAEQGQRAEVLPAVSQAGHGQTAGARRASNESGQNADAQNSAPSRANANASRLRQMEPQHVTLCDARSILEGVRLRNHELGRGSYGIVVPGSYRGVPCAAKVMLSKGVDRAVLRELLLGPNLSHPNVIITYITRCAHLTHNFFDLLEGGTNAERDPTLPRVLGPLPINSDEGFGDPQGVEDGGDPLVVLHNLLHSLGAETGMTMVIVIQEFCDRGTLDTAIRRNVFRPSRNWSERVARRAMVRTATEVARGLLHLHETGVVHGDIKPANVLLTSSRDDRRGFIAKVTDFGLSRVLPHAASSMSTEATGSLAYMAPETFDRKLSKATDVWSFGVTLWELLTGRRPYEGMNCTIANITTRVRDGTLVLPWPATPFDAGLVALGRRCLSHDPADRPTFLYIVEELVGIERAMRAEIIAAKEAAAQAAAAASRPEAGPSRPAAVAAPSQSS